MRPEIDFHVMQDMGEIARGKMPGVDAQNLEIEALLEALRVVAVTTNS